jgi:hypothetical protein
VRLDAGREIGVGSSTSSWRESGRRWSMRRNWMMSLCAARPQRRGFVRRSSFRRRSPKKSTTCCSQLSSVPLAHLHRDRLHLLVTAMSTRHTHDTHTHDTHDTHDTTHTTHTDTRGKARAHVGG